MLHTQYGVQAQALERFAYGPAGNLKDPQGGLLPGSVLQPGPAGEVPHNQVRVFEDKRYYYDGHGRLIVKLSGAHRAQYFHWNDEHQLVATHTVWSEGQNQRQRPRSLEEAKAQTLKAERALKEAKVTRTHFEYDALGRRSSVQVYSGSGQSQKPTSHTEFLWEGMRLLQERQIETSGEETKTQRTVTYVYEPGSYVPLARIDSQAEDKAGQPQRFEAQEAANSERYSAGSGGRGPGSGSNASQKAQLYYFHTDTSGLPQELSDAGGALRWRASYQTWGNTVKKEWMALGLNGAAQVEQDPNETAPQKLEQNLRFQGQYLDRSTGLHYNTFRYYDPDIGRFISPDPIGLAGGDNLYQYAPNPVSWIDPWGWAQTPLDAPGYTTYGLYRPGETTPYYIGHTNQSTKDRLSQHQRTGRADGSTEIRSLSGKEGSLTYSQSKGYEQAYREMHKTKTGFPGNVIEPINKTRTDPRGASHMAHYNEKMNAPKGGGC